MSDTRSITVELGERSYPIFIGSDLLDGGFDLSAHVRGPDCLVVTNETVEPLYLDALVANLTGKQVRVISLPDGEAYKTLETVEDILDTLVENGANRDTTVVALGGGVVGDIAGFAAACYMRGVDFVQAPTTLLAQVDSSVGGKTGVNHASGKNLIGAFHQPRAVLIDTGTLKTLPDRELKAGLAEVIKYGAIVDADFFAWIEDNLEALIARDADALAAAVQRSCELKAGIVAEDERERGRRALLNFGHTFGHAIEHCQGYGKWLHGEAVAVGIIMAAELSVRLGRLQQGDASRVRALLEAFGLPVQPPPIGARAMRALMAMDKKVSAGRLRLVLFDGLGASSMEADTPLDELAAVLAAAGSG